MTIYSTLEEALDSIPQGAIESWDSIGHIASVAPNATVSFSGISSDGEITHVWIDRLKTGMYSEPELVTVSASSCKSLRGDIK